jgi:hypothetical protein
MPGGREIVRVCLPPRRYQYTYRLPPEVVKVERRGPWWTARNSRFPTLRGHGRTGADAVDALAAIIGRRAIGKGRETLKRIRGIR